MVLLRLLHCIWEYVSDLRSSSFWMALSGYAICCAIAIRFDSYLDVDGYGRSSPDLLFGYTHEYLKELLEGWGPEGRNWYATVLGRFDLFPYIPSYVVLIGGLFRNVANSLPYRHYYSLQILAMALFDYLETITQIYLVQSYPTLNPSLVVLGSTANRLKWSTFGIIILQILIGFALGFFTDKKEKNEIATGKKSA